MIQTEVMMIVQCQLVYAHQAIYRMLNKIAAARLRIGVYVFDQDGCQYPDRTMNYEPIDTRLFSNNARVNNLVVNPVFIDVKEGRARKRDDMSVRSREDIQCPDSRVPSASQGTEK